jgi:23S rRNA pseudouridine955/2504/2580 synthase
MKTPVQTFTVTPEEAGQKLLQYLLRRLAGLPRSALQRFIRTGQVRLDGKRCKPFDRVSAGQFVRVPPYDPDAPGQAATPAAPTPAAPPASRPTARTSFRPAARPVTVDRSAKPARGPNKEPVLDILHEDAELLVVVKPAGLPVHPGSGHAFALTTLLTAHCPDAPFRPTPAHRLDRDTTGVLLVAKSYRMLRHIHEAMLAGEIRKDYLAWVRGRWLLGEENEWVTFRDKLEKSGGPGRERVRPGEAGKEAVSKARLLGLAREASLIEVRLETGRTHQIRAQLASRGYPLVGDAKYGGGAPPMRLHAGRVVLPDAAFCAPPDWAAPWAVMRPRRTSLTGCRDGSVSETTEADRPDVPE